MSATAGQRVPRRPEARAAASGRSHPSTDCGTNPEPGKLGDACVEDPHASRSGGHGGEIGFAPQAVDGASWSDEEARRGFEANARLILSGNPEESRSLLNPLHPGGGGSHTHHGVRRWQSRDDPEWQVLAQWVRGERAGNNGSLQRLRALATSDDERSGRRRAPAPILPHHRTYGSGSGDSPQCRSARYLPMRQTSPPRRQRNTSASRASNTRGRTQARQPVLSHGAMGCVPLFVLA